MSTQLNLLPDIKKEYIKSNRLQNSIILIALAISGFFIALVLILISTVFVVQKQAIKNISNNIDEKIEEINSVPELDKVLTIQNQINELTPLHDKSPESDRLFDYLAVLTPTNVQLESFELVFEKAEAKKTSSKSKSTDKESSSSKDDSSSDTKSEDKTTVTKAGGKIEISGITDSLKDVNRFADILKNAKYVAVGGDESKEVKGNAFKSVSLDSATKNSRQNSQEKTRFTIIVEFDSAIFDSTYKKVTVSVPSIESSVSSTEKPNFRKGSGANPFDDGGTQ